MREPRTDQELLTRLKAGDETAIRDVAETYGSKIYQLAFRYLRNKEDATIAGAFQGRRDRFLRKRAQLVIAPRARLLDRAVDFKTPR